MTDPAASQDIARIYSATDDTWAIEFTDGVTLHCAKQSVRRETHVDNLIAEHAQREGDDHEHTLRMQAMIRAVRDLEREGDK